MPRRRDGTVSDSVEIDRYPAVRDELVRLESNVMRIIERGRDVFFEEDETNYLAACQLIINFDDLARNRLPSTVKEAHADIPWAAISQTPNILAHNYLATDREIVWRSVSGELPELIARVLRGG